MEYIDIADRYRKTWSTFAQDISQLSKELIDTGNPEGSTFHNLLKSLQPAPYEEAPAFFAGLVPNHKERRSNIGSVTGLFFELVAASIIKGYINKHVPEAEIELNRCSEPRREGIPRDPDVFIRHKGHHLVFELKTSPKKVDLDRAVWCHSQYEAHKTKYFLIGGHVSSSSKYLLYLSNEKWACFTSCSEGNESVLESLPRLDNILSDAVSFLLGQ